MVIRYVEPLEQAWGRMKRILFAPFDLGRWLLIAFSLWLARLASGGGSTGPGNLGGNKGEAFHDALGGMHHAWEWLLEQAFWIPIIIMGALVVLVLVLVAIWVSSRGRFIFLDNVVRNRAEITEPWHRLKRLGDSLFVWRLCFGLVMLFVIGALLLLVLGPALVLSWHNPFEGLSIAAIAALGVVGLVIGVVAALVSLFLDSFVVPIMYRFDLTATAAWRSFLPWLRAHPGHFVLYALLVLALAIGTAIVQGVLCLFTCCLMCIPLLGSYLAAVLMLPLWVTYRAFTVQFLAQLDPGFDLFAAALPPPPTVDEAASRS